MNDPVVNSISLTGICASLCGAFGIDSPEKAEESIDILTKYIEKSGGPVDRIVMYNPDAVAMWLYQKYTSWYTKVTENAPLALPLCTVMPSVTPVCFGTMYTGALPEVHGIRSYTKPVIKIDTIFDALIRAGKKPVIVSTQNDSLSLIFLERNMDYFIMPTVDECTEKMKELLAEDKYDFYLLYNGDYDSTMHRNAPEGESSLEILRKNIRVFGELADIIRENFKGKRTLLGFAPDHGCHEIDGGLGSHGLDMPEDLNILHFYGIIGQEV